MRFLLEPPELDGLHSALEAACAARDAGLDGILMASSPALPAPLVVVAALAPAVQGILLAAEVPLGDRHPIELAEEAAVTDLVAAGRLLLAVTPASGRGEVFPEALDLLRTALAARPFRFDGEHWTVPARLPQNEHNLEDRTRVTPSPLQARLEIWTSGAGAGPDAHRALGHLALAGSDPVELGAAWARSEDALGPALLGAPRARRHDYVDAGALVEDLQTGRREFGQDWAVVRAPAECAPEIGRDVRPHVQLDRLPLGLREHWASAPV
jgi:alkanesulfonate monooxygenase SsuD/methylene tetrahydromethanopterin reductase-like flavin-dependent oxidoreductase (luciferase family)